MAKAPQVYMWLHHWLLTPHVSLKNSRAVHSSLIRKLVWLFVWQVTTAIIVAGMTRDVLLCNNFTTSNQLYLNWLLTPHVSLKNTSISFFFDSQIGLTCNSLMTTCSIVMLIVFFFRIKTMILLKWISPNQLRVQNWGVEEHLSSTPNNH